jgi:transposase
MTRLRALPIDVRPRIGESAKGYIRRLARANHLRPSYLYQHLCEPPSYNGVLQPERLAQITDRPLTALTRALPELGTEGAQSRLPTTAPKREHVTGNRRIRLFAAIRRDADTGYSIRALAARHHVHRRTVRQALTDLAPPPRRKPPRRPKAIDHLQRHVDPLIEQGLSALEIWAEIFDNHDPTIGYSSIRTYIARRRQEADRARP